MTNKTIEGKELINFLSFEIYKITKKKKKLRDNLRKSLEILETEEKAKKEEIKKIKASLKK